MHPEFDHEERVFAGLRSTLRELLPALDGVRFTHAWGGPLGIARDWHPSVTCDPGTRTGRAGGYVGDGVAATNLAGRTLADLVLGRSSALTALPWVGHRSPSWEPEPLRWLGVNAGLRLARLADAEEERTGRPSRLGRGARAPHRPRVAFTGVHEIETLVALDAALDAGAPLRGLRLQDLDLTGRAARLLRREDVEGLVVLGGRLPDDLARHLHDHGALVFPTDPHCPVDPYRATLYSPDELFAGLREVGYRPPRTPAPTGGHATRPSRTTRSSRCCGPSTTTR